MRRRWVAALAALAAGGAQAGAVDWRLLSEEGADLGGLRLDFDLPRIEEVLIQGDLGLYTLPSFAFLDTSDWVGPERVHDFLLAFSPETGRTYFQDYGGGESSTIRVNESAVQIGTLDRPLTRTGGRHRVIFNEVYNFDESYIYCIFHEELYDEETGDYVQTGRCLQTWTDTSYNIDAGYWNYGWLVAAAVETPETAETPLPGAGAALVAGLAGLGWLRFRRR